MGPELGHSFHWFQREVALHRNLTLGFGSRSEPPIVEVSKGMRGGRKEV